MAKESCCGRSVTFRLLLLLHLTVAPSVGAAAIGLGKYDPCNTAGHLSRVRTPPHQLSPMRVLTST